MTLAPLTVSMTGTSLLTAFGGVPDGVEIVEWNLLGPAPRDHFDIVVPPYMSGLAGLANLAGVTSTLVQSQSIGYDGVKEVLPAGTVFANAASVHETSTAELAMALILASQRQIPAFVRSADRGVWAPRESMSLADRSVLLIGYGGVGKALEARLLPFETHVTRVARTARLDERGPIHDFSAVAALLPTADIVVVQVPLSEATRHLVDDAFLSRMRDGALLVNIARGPVVNTAALLKHTRSGRLRAALDVTDPEPLPAGHELFTLDNVLISPHVGGDSSAMWPRMAKLVHRQIELMRAGDEPVNVVLRT